MGDTDRQTPRWIGGIKPPEELLAASGVQILEIECREQPQRLHDLIQAYRMDSSVRAELKNFAIFPGEKARSSSSAWAHLTVLPSVDRFFCKHTEGFPSR